MAYPAEFTYHHINYTKKKSLKATDTMRAPTLVSPIGGEKSVEHNTRHILWVDANGS